MKLLLLEQKAGWKQTDIARETLISPSEIAYSLERLKRHDLITEDKKKVNRAALNEFLVHALKYIFPGKKGAPARGVPTASAYVFAEKIRTPAEFLLVWPHSEGRSRGVSLEPIYKTVPEIAVNDMELYTLLCLADILRSKSTAREVNLAQEELKRILFKKSA
ncbi:MAG: hypothetical protein JST80_06645 [Bdellovibrionales bacterium]|nr:hypothetical protein [Bdellovibrionales bacterium]